MGGTRAPEAERSPLRIGLPVAAKLTGPALDPRLVDRLRLVDALVAHTGRNVVVTAPAGYGKSTLAAQWSARDPRPSGWITIDGADRDPYLLLTYVAAALDAIDPLPDGSLDRLTRADLELEHLLDELAAVLASRPRPFLLVLDDVHLLGDAIDNPVLRAVGRHRAPGSTMAFLTRAAPPLRVSRAIVGGELLCLEARDLALAPEETTALLHTVGFDPDDELATSVHELTEGWPAGVYMAALALRDSDDPRAAARDLRGRQRRIADFFSEEVLPALDPSDLEFLLATAVLDRCCGELCDAALERSGSGAVLERLARENRFVIPLDDVGEWYRYHHLFGDMLHAEQCRRDPDGAGAVARRASAWWEQQSDPDRAFWLALAAGERRRAIELVARFSPILQNSRRIPTVDRWIHAFADDEVVAEPALAVTAAWNALLTEDVERVQRFATAVELRSETGPFPDGTPPAAAAALLRALTTSRGLGEVRRDASRAFDEHPPTSPYRAIAALLDGAARHLLGETERGRERTETAIALGRVHLHPVVAQGLAMRARAEVIEGDWIAAARSIDEAMEVVEEHWLGERPAIGQVIGAAALVHAKVGRTDRADEERIRGRRLIERQDDVLPFLGAMTVVELAESALITGHVDEATELLGDAERRLRRLRDTGLLPFALERVGAMVSAQVRSPARPLVEPLSPAELRVLHYLPTHLSFGEIGEELFVSRNTVKTHAMAIYRKLGVTSRSAAVREATQHGLLSG